MSMSSLAGRLAFALILILAAFGASSSRAQVIPDAHLLDASTISITAG